MRIHYSSVVTIVVALFFVSGNVGCITHAGGPWYSPKSYAVSSPFSGGGSGNSKLTPAPLWSQNQPRQAPKPPLDQTPNIDGVLGGYTDTGYVQRAPSRGTTSPQDQWGTQNHLMSNNSQSPHAGYSGITATPSQYPQTFTGQYPSAPAEIAAASYQYQGNPNQQFYPEAGQRSFHADPGMGSQAYQPMTNYTPYDNIQGANPQYNAPFSPMNHDPNAGILQQPSIPPPGFGLDQQPMSHFPPYQPPAGGYMQ